MAAPWREQQQQWASPPLYGNAAPATASASEADSVSINTLYATGGANRQQQMQRQGTAQVFRMPPPPPPPLQQQQELLTDSARQQYEQLRQQRPVHVRQHVLLSPVAVNAPGVAQDQQQHVQLQLQQQRLQAQRLAHMNQLKQQEQQQQQQRLQRPQKQQRLKQQQRKLQQQQQLQLQQQGQQQQLQQQQIQRQQQQQQRQPQQQYQWSEASSTMNAYSGYQQEQGQQQMQQQQQNKQRKQLQRQQRQQKKEQRQLELQQKKQQQLQLQLQQQQQQYQYQQQQYQQQAVPFGMDANKVTQQSQPRPNLQQQQQSQPRQQPQQRQIHPPQQQQQQYPRQQQQQPSRLNANKATLQPQPQQLQKQQSQQQQVPRQQQFQPHHQQQFQRAFQFLDSEIRESANSGNNSDSSGTGQRSSTVIQPGVAIVPPHYRDQIPMEMPALPRLGPPSFQFSFVQSHGGYSGSSYGGYPGSEYANGGGAQNGMVSNNLQSPAPHTTNSASVTFVPFGAASDSWMLPFTDYNNSNDNSNSSVSIDNHFGQTTWNREQHYSPAVSAISPSFNANGPGHQSPNVFSESHQMLSLQQQQEENLQQRLQQQQQQHNPATMAAAKALYGLQSPVNSPRWNEVNAEVNNANSWPQMQSRVTNTSKKASAEFALSRIVNPLAMSVEDQNKELMNAAESAVGDDFLNVLARSAGYDSDAMAGKPAPVQRVPIPVPVHQPPRQEAAPQQLSAGYFASNSHMNTVGARDGNGVLAPSHAPQSVENAVIPPANKEPKKRAPVKWKRVNNTVTVQERQVQMPMPALSTTFSLSLDEGWVVPEPISKKKVVKPRVKAAQKLKENPNEPSPPASAETTVKKKSAPVKRRKKQEEVTVPSKMQAPPVFSAVQPPQPNRVVAPYPPVPTFARPPDGQLNASRLPAAAMAMPTASHAVRNLMNPVETASNHRQGLQPPTSLAAGMAPVTDSEGFHRPPESVSQLAASGKKKADPTVSKQLKAKQPSAKRRNAQGTATNAPKTSRKRKSDTLAAGSQLGSNLSNAVQSGASGNIRDTVKEAMETLMTEVTVANSRFPAFNQSPFPGSMQVSSIGGAPSVVTSSYERMVMGNGGTRPTASEKNVATAQPTAVSVKDMVPPFNAPSIIDLTAEDKSTVQISAESSSKASTPLAQRAVEVAFAGIQLEATTTGGFLEQLQSSSTPSVSSQPNNTIMIFCKRDFMRYQAAKLWKKYQEKKKKMEFQSVQVLGKRTRYVNAKYEEEKLAKLQKKAKAPKKIRKSKSAESSETSQSSSPSVPEQIDVVTESAQSSDVEPAEPTRISYIGPTEYALLNGLESLDGGRPSDKIPTDEAPAVETKSSEQLRGSEATPAAEAFVWRPTDGTLSMKSAEEDAVPAENPPFENATVTSAAEALDATPLEQPLLGMLAEDASTASHAVEALGEMSTERDLNTDDRSAVPSEEASSAFSTLENAPVATPIADPRTSSATPSKEAVSIGLPIATRIDGVSTVGAPVVVPTTDTSSEQPHAVRSVLEALEAAIAMLTEQSPSTGTKEQSPVDPSAQEASSAMPTEKEAQVVTPRAHAPLVASPEKRTDVVVPVADIAVISLIAKVPSAMPSAEASLTPGSDQTQVGEPVADAEVMMVTEQDQSVKDEGAGHAPRQVSATVQATLAVKPLDNVSSLALAEKETLVPSQTAKDKVVISAEKTSSSAELPIAVSTSEAPSVSSYVAEAETSSGETSGVMQLHVVISVPKELETAGATSAEQLPSMTPSDQARGVVVSAAEAQVTPPTEQEESVSDVPAENVLNELSATAQSVADEAVATSSARTAEEETVAASQAVEDPVIVPCETASSAELSILAPTEEESLTTLLVAEAHDGASTSEEPRLTPSEQSQVATLAAAAIEASAAIPIREQCSSATPPEQPPSPAYESPSETPSVNDEITQVEMPSVDVTMVPLIAECSSATPNAESLSTTSPAPTQDAISDDEYQMVPVLELDQSVKDSNTDASLLAPDTEVQSDARAERVPCEIPIFASAAVTPHTEAHDAPSMASPVEMPVATQAEDEPSTAKAVETVPATVTPTDEAAGAVSPMVGAPSTPTGDWSVTPTSNFSTPEPVKQAPGAIVALEALRVQLFERSALIAQAFSSKSFAQAPATPTEVPRGVAPVAKTPSPASRAQAPVARQPVEAPSAVVTSRHTQILILRPDASIVVAPSGQVSSAISAARSLRVTSAAAEGSSAMQDDESVRPTGTGMDESPAMERAARKQAPREELIWISASAPPTGNSPRNTMPSSDRVANMMPTEQATTNDVAMSSEQAPTATLASKTAMEFERASSVALTELVPSSHRAKPAEVTPSDVIVSSTEQVASSEAQSIELNHKLDDSKCLLTGEVKLIEESSSSGESTVEMMPVEAIPPSDATKFAEQARINKVTPEELQSSSNEVVVAEQTPETQLEQVKQVPGEELKSLVQLVSREEIELTIVALNDMVSLAEPYQSNGVNLTIECAESYEVVNPDQQSPQMVLHSTETQSGSAAEQPPLSEARTLVESPSEALNETPRNEVISTEQASPKAAMPTEDVHAASGALMAPEPMRRDSVESAEPASCNKTTRSTEQRSSNKATSQRDAPPEDCSAGNDKGDFELTGSDKAVHAEVSQGDTMELSKGQQGNTTKSPEQTPSSEVDTVVDERVLRTTDEIAVEEDPSIQVTLPEQVFSCEGASAVSQTLKVLTKSLIEQDPSNEADSSDAPVEAQSD